MSDFDNENEQDFTGAVIEKLKELFSNRVAVIIMAAVIVVIAVIIIAVSVISGNSPESFDTPSVLAQTAGEDKSISFSKDGLAVTVRIADICDFDEETGSTYTSLYYSDESDEKYVFADYIIKNNSSKDVTIECGTHSDDSLSLYLGYFNDVSDKVDDNNNNDFCAFYRLYDRASGAAASTSEVVIKAKETKEFTLRYSIRVDRIKLCNGVYFCKQWDTGDDYTKYAVMGIGKPVISYGFKNSELFPQLNYSEKAAADGNSSVDTDSYRDFTPGAESTKYPMTKVDSNSLSFYNINSIADSPYKLSAEIAAQGSPERNLTADISGYSAFVDNEAIQGPVVELQYNPEYEVEKIKIMFEIKPEAVNNTLGTYTGSSDEFVGIKRFNVFMFDEEANMQLPIATFFDTDKNIVYAETDRCGTYSLIDMEIWLDMLGITPD